MRKICWLILAEAELDGTHVTCKASEENTIVNLRFLASPKLSQSKDQSATLTAKLKPSKVMLHFYVLIVSISCLPTESSELYCRESLVEGLLPVFSNTQYKFSRHTQSSSCNMKSNWFAVDIVARQYRDLLG